MGYTSYWDRRDSSNSGSWRNPNTPQGQANIRYENRLCDAQSRRESRSSSSTTYSGGNSRPEYQPAEESASESGRVWSFLNKLEEVTETVLKVGAVVVGSVIVLAVADGITQRSAEPPETRVR